MRTKLIKISIIIGCLVYLSLLPSIAAQTRPQDPIALSFAEFHADTNQIVNQKIDQFTKLNKKITSAKDIPSDLKEQLTTPLALDEVSCDKNLSASCLQFLINLNFKALTTEIQDSLSTLEISGGSITTANLSQEQGNRLSLIQTELESINDSVEQTLIFYQQLLLSLPLHNSYKLSSQELDKYISNLQKLEFYIQKYPSKYNNVTTPYCQ